MIKSKKYLFISSIMLNMDFRGSSRIPYMTQDSTEAEYLAPSPGGNRRQFQITSDESA